MSQIVCQSCGQTKEHHARGLCRVCYHRIFTRPAQARYMQNKRIEIRRREILYFALSANGSTSFNENKN